MTKKHHRGKQTEAGGTLDRFAPRRRINRRAHHCDENRHRACDARKQRQRHTRDRSHLPGLTGRQTRLLKRLASGLHLGVSRGLCLLRDGIVIAKAWWQDVKWLIAQGFLTPLFGVTLAGKALCDHFGTPDQTDPAKRVIAIERNDNAAEAKAALLRAGQNVPARVLA